MFPFDIELFNFMYGKDLSDENVLLAADRFKIPVELVRDKIREYISYFYTNSSISNNIDSEKTFKLSKIYVENYENQEINTPRI